MVPTYRLPVLVLVLINSRDSRVEIKLDNVPRMGVSGCLRSAIVDIVVVSGGGKRGAKVKQSEAANWGSGGNGLQCWLVVILHVLN